MAFLCEGNALRKRSSVNQQLHIYIHPAALFSGRKMTRRFWAFFRQSWFFVSFLSRKKKVRKKRVFSWKFKIVQASALSWFFVQRTASLKCANAHLLFSRKKKIRNQLAKRVRSYSDFKVEVLLCTFSKLSLLADYQPETISDCMKLQ